MNPHPDRPDDFQGPAVKLLRTLFGYKAWANHDLFRLMSAVPPGENEVAMHACTRLLNHTYVVDRIFEANVQREPHSYTALNTPETPALPALHESVRVTDQWYLDYLTSLSDPDLEEVIDFTFASGSHGRMSRGEMLMHVITHGNYHRGGVGRMLLAASITPPPDDILTAYLHRGGRPT